METLGAVSRPLPLANEELPESHEAPGRLDLAKLAEETRGMSRAAFLARQRSPFLVQLQALAEPEADLTARFPTVVMASARFRAAAVGLPPYAYALEKRPHANAFALMVTLGRATNNDIVVPDASVSKFHASFAGDGAGGWTLTDWSTNGTWVDGERLAPRVARRIRFGASVTLAGKIPMLLVSASDLFEMLGAARAATQRVA